MNGPAALNFLDCMGLNLFLMLELNYNIFLKKTFEFLVHKFYLPPFLTAVSTWWGWTSNSL